MEPDVPVEQNVAPPSTEVQPDEHHHDKLMRWMNSINIADELDEETLSSIGQDVVHECEIDERSRAKWKEDTEKAMKLAMQVAETKQYPWPRAANVIYPLMTTAAIQFAARAYPAIVSGKQVVKGVVVGDDSGIFQMGPQTQQPQMMVAPGVKADRAAKIGEHMSWQLLTEQPEWEEETDRLLHILPIVGCAFRKSYFDPSKGRNVALLVMADKIVINYNAKSIETAPRITELLELYPLEIKDMERAKAFTEIDYPLSGNADGDPDAPHDFLEQHRWWDLDDDGYPEPYTVTVHKQSAKVVRIVARYDVEGIRLGGEGGQDILKIDAIEYYTKYDFLPNPEGGIYGVGFGQLLRPINEAVNTSLNMIIDSGHLAVAGGGFIGKGLSMHTGAMRFTPGEYKTVNVSGATVKENVVPLQFPGPSPVLFNLLGTLIESGKDIAAVKDVLTGENKNSNVPATTILALIEQGLKVFTAIYKRIHRSLKKELEKQFRLNRLHLPENGKGFRIDNQFKSITRKDYEAAGGVEPVSDPTMVSDMQKLGRAQFLMGFMNDPWFDGKATRMRILNAAAIEKPQELLVQQQAPNPEHMEQQAKLEVSNKRADAEVLVKRAQAILFMSQADKLVGDHHIDWLNHQLEVIKSQYEAMVKNAEGGPEGATGGGGAGLPPMEAPPSNQSPSPVHAGLPNGPQGGGLAALAHQQGG